MIPPQLIIAGVIAVSAAATGFGAAWKIQNGIQAERELEYAQQQLENQRLVAKTRTRQDQAVIAAVGAGTTRSIALRRDADGSRDALIGLSHAAESTLRDASTSLNACTQRANTLGELFLASTERYRSVAEKAGRHASDVQTLSDGWPK